jgi:mycobactin lysine-N-oxygenase
VALAAKGAALGSLDWITPEVVLVDPAGVAGHWLGAIGYTDGQHPLGTPPEKDVGFPYSSEDWGESNGDIDRAMLTYSWAAYLIVAGETALPYAAWVDRGKPAPRHFRWAQYLNWAAETASATVIEERVVSIDCTDGGWHLGLASGSDIAGDALVVTGPGPAAHKISVKSPSPLVLDGVSFWQLSRLGTRFGQRPNVCVIGSGETAAAIVVQLVDVLPGCFIDVVSRQGVVYTRGESFEENHVYSNPRKWAELSEESRRDFIRRTDRGVFSIATKNVLNDAENVDTVAGTVMAVEPRRNTVRVVLKGQPNPTAYNLVIDATGFDRLWFLALMTSRARAALETAIGKPVIDESALEDAIDADLAVVSLAPRLHLPMFAGLTQGPGFPNLSSLGMLADRILRDYCERP